MISEERVQWMSSLLINQMIASAGKMDRDLLESLLRKAAQEAAAEQIRKDAHIAFRYEKPLSGCEVGQMQVRMEILAQLPPTKTEVPPVVDYSKVDFSPIFEGLKKR